MSQYDKFMIIENHINPKDKKKIISKMENYFENVLKTDTKIFISDYINQIIWFEKIDLDNFSVNIEIHLKNYLIQHRNNIRTFIKKENFELSHLNKFFKKFISKLEYLNNIIKSSNDKIIKEGIKQLINLIISDSLILIFIEEQISSLNIELITEIKTLITFVKQLSNYDNFEIFNKIITIFANIFIKQIIEIEEILLPMNIKRIQKLNDTIKYYYKIKDYFKFISQDINQIKQQIYIIIIEYLSDIIKNNSLDEIEYVFKNIWDDINKLTIENNFEGKNELLNNISNEIISLVIHSVKSQNLDNIIKLINILIYVDIFINQTKHKEIINQKITTIIGTAEFIENIQLIIDSLIRNAQKKEVIQLIQFVVNIKDKDIFINKYYQYLIKRLLEKISDFKTHNTIPEKYFCLEKQVFNFLKSKFGDKLVYKINKVITDTEVSFGDNLHFNTNMDKYINEIDVINNKMTVITTSFNNWDINQTEGLVNSKIIKSIKDTQLGKHLRAYHKYYKSRYLDKRILNWFPHFGEVNITYLEKEIIMLPIQFMVLEMFNDVNCILVNDVMASQFFTNYTYKFTHDIIGSLITSRLFKINNDLMILTSSNNFNTNLIEVFFSTSDYVNIWEQRRKDELILSREEIVYANINHQIKIKPMTKSQLFDSLVKVIEVFELDEIVFNKALDYMCKMDYITIKEDSYTKIVY